jgi:hypothetical protein
MNAAFRSTERFFFVATATVLVGLSLLAFRIPLTADDYGAIVASLSKPDAYWRFFGPLVARLPASNLMTMGALELRLWEAHPAAFLVMGFAAHAAAFALLVEWLQARIPALAAPSHGSRALPWAAGFVIFLPHAVFPNNHEIHLWYSIALHPFGALAGALAIRAADSRNAGASRSGLPLKVALFTLSFCFYESFIFLAAGAAAISWYTSAPRRRWSSPELLAPAAAFLAFLALRGLLAHLFGGTNERPIDLEILPILGRLRWTLKTMLVLSFRKDSWPLGIVEWTAAALALGSLIREKILSWKEVAFLLAVPFAVSTPAALLPYSAIRALYGPNLLRAALLCAFTLRAVRGDGPPRVAAFGATALFTLAYALQWVHILSIKDANAQVLGELEARTRARLLACTSPCSLEVPRPDQGLRADWVIHPFYFQSFYERLRLETTPEKNVLFLIR